MIKKIKIIESFKRDVRGRFPSMPNPFTDEQSTRVNWGRIAKDMPAHESFEREALPRTDHFFDRAVLRGF
jgi:hypothetical protein